MTLKNKYMVIPSKYTSYGPKEKELLKINDKPLVFIKDELTSEMVSVQFVDVNGGIIQDPNGDLMYNLSQQGYPIYIYDSIEKPMESAKSWKNEAILSCIKNNKIK